MSFGKILARRGREISQIQITRTNDSGYISKSESSANINAMVQPLSQEERLFWSEARIEKATLKLYTGTSMNVGDKVTINGENYKVAATDSHEDAKITGYVKVIVEKHG